MPNGSKNIPLGICVVSHDAAPQFGVIVTEGHHIALQRALRSIIANLDDTAGVKKWHAGHVRDILQDRGYICLPVAFLDEP